MIDANTADQLRHTEYNSDPVVMEMLETIEILWKQNRTLENALHVATKAMLKCDKQAEYFASLSQRFRGIALAAQDVQREGLGSISKLWDALAALKEKPNEG